MNNNTLLSNILWEKIEKQANRFPEKIILKTPNEHQISYKNFVQCVNMQAIIFQKQGIKNNQKVIFLQKPSIAAMVSFFALSRVGVILVIADPKMGNENFLSRVKFSQSSHIIVDQSVYIAKKIPFLFSFLRMWGINIPDLNHTNIPPIVTAKSISILLKLKNNFSVIKKENNSDALIVFTSGTTSQPKGVIHTFESLLSMIQIIQEEINPQESDIFYSNQFHFMLIALVSGSLSIIQISDFFTPENFIKISKRFHITQSFLLPKEGEELFQYCMQKKKKIPDSYKNILFGSAPVFSGFLSRFQKIISKNTSILSLYGATEILPISIIKGKEKIAYKGKGDILGKAVKNTTIQIQKGEICVQGNHLCKQYLGEKNPLFVFKTGDLGEVDKNGNIILLGRKKDMIIKGNHNIYPTLFEATVNKIEGVGSCSFIGIYDSSINDEKIILCIENNSKYSDEIFTKFIYKQLKNGKYSIDQYALPDEIFCLSLPRSGRSQKINKERLKEIIKTQYVY